MRLNSFDEVVAQYERTKRLVSNNHSAERDVRPIGDRKRKWERIKKIDDYTYALCDGNYGNLIWDGHHTSTSAGHHEYENTMAPIVWMRRSDGDFIRVCNHNKSSRSVTRYNFLHYYLPNGMCFNYNSNNKHWIRYRDANGKYEELVLPKSEVKFDYRTGIGATQGAKHLVFRANADGTFTRVGDKLLVKVDRVDKDEKKLWREHLDKFYEFCAAVAPMVDTTWTGRADYRQQIIEWQEAIGDLSPIGWQRTTQSIPTSIVRQAVADENHPLRVAVAVFVIAEIDGKRTVETQDDLRAIRAAYNRVMNKAMGFYKVVEV